MRVIYSLIASLSNWRWQNNIIWKGFQIKISLPTEPLKVEHLRLENEGSLYNKSFCCSLFYFSFLYLFEVNILPNKTSTVTPYYKEWHVKLHNSFTFIYLHLEGSLSSLYSSTWSRRSSTIIEVGFLSKLFSIFPSYFNIPSSMSLSPYALSSQFLVSC